MALKANYYDLLGIPRDAMPEEIRHAYRELALKLHPDVNPDAIAAETFLQIQKAYEVLNDNKLRTEYDRLMALESDDPVGIEILYSRSHVTKMDESQILYALLDFSASVKYTSQSAPPLNISLVIDRSTSMQGVRMDTVKAAAIEMVRQLRNEDLLSIIVFSDRAEVLMPATRRADRGSIETQIRMVRAGGGTEIYQGLLASLAEINRNLAHSMINHIILLTDGRTYGDEEACMQLASRASSQGIGITGLGMGTEWNDVFLDELVSRTGGTSFYVSRMDDLRTFLQEKFTSLSQIYAERTSLKLKLTPGIILQAVFRLQPEAGSLAIETSSNNEVNLKLGSIPKQSALSILLEFVMPPIIDKSLRLPIANGEINMILSSDPSIPRNTLFDMSRLVNDTVSTDLPPRRIFQALSQITLYRMQEKARREVSEGKIQQASIRLQRLATQLFSLGEKELARTAFIEAERIQQTHMLSPEGEKHIKYGTRSLVLPSTSNRESQ